MRFMMFMLPNLPEDADWTPSAEAVAEMMTYNDSLVKAGVLLDANGLHPENEAVRVTHADGKRTVTDGPFSEAKEVIGGYWLIDVKSKEEAVEWASRCPEDGCSIELRQIFEIDEFPPDVQAAAQSHA
jgi:hypothetical protein